MGFLPQRTQRAQRVQGNLFTMGFLPQRTQRAQRVQGNLFTMGFLPQRTQRVQRVQGNLFTMGFLPQRTQRAQRVQGNLFTMGFLPQRTQRAQRVQGNYSPIFLCLISLRSSASSAVYTLFMVFNRRERRGFKVITHQSFYAIFLCAVPRPLRFIHYS